MRLFFWSGIFLNLLCLSPLVLRAQPDNGQAFQNMVEAFLKKNPQAFSSTEGIWPTSWRPAFQADTSNPHLRIGEIWVDYQKVEGKRYQREIRIPLSWQDSSQQQATLEYVDTLDIVTLRRLRRASPAPLRGDAPGLLSSWVRPLSIMGGSIATLVALFYIRSQN